MNDYHRVATLEEIYKGFKMSFFVSLSKSVEQVEEY